ncbi:MAG: hypothetical protein ACREPS_03715 [Rhodanobacteraceae bacterium]
MAANPVGIGLALAVVARARRRAQQAGEQVGAAGASRALGGVRRQALEDGFGFGFGDERRMRVALDLPFGPRPPAMATDGCTTLARGVYVPDRVSGVGERVPFKPDQRRLAQREPGRAHRFGATDANRARLQVGRDC